MRVIFKRKFFPYTNKESDFKNRVTLGIGGNLGDTPRIFRSLFLWLQNNKKINIIHTSHLFQNPPFGYTNQNDFINAIIVFKTNLNLLAVFNLIFYLERRFGRARIRPFKNAPRTLDIDLIFFNQLNLKRDYLTIPHYDFKNRESVLIPMFV